MVKPITFEPEIVSQPTPMEQIQIGRQQSFDIFNNLQKSVNKFDLKQFINNFMLPLINTYNADAKKLGLPEAKSNWFEIIKTFGGGAWAQKDFFVKNRNMIQPAMFPGDQEKASKAYDLFLKEIDTIPHVVSGPISGTLSHELGHVQTYLTDPNIPSASIGPFDKDKSARPKVEKIINEAVASWQGFQKAWKTWEQYGIPHKAWGAWVGFPTYTKEITELQLSDLFNKLKTLETKYPGIEDQVKKVLFEYRSYVEPVMYNIPGKDWTEDEKVSLKRFLESHGGVYKETLPEDEKEKLQHMKKQPFVMSTPIEHKISSFPFSKRKRIPFSRREI